MPYMYILECANKSYYTGSTWNLERRLIEHQSGLGAKHTIRRLPVKLVYYEECARIVDAFAREKQVQGWGRKKKQSLIDGGTNQLHRLAECQNDSHSKNVPLLTTSEFNQPSKSAQARSLRLRSGNRGDGSSVAVIEVNDGTDVANNSRHDVRQPGGFDSAQPPERSPLPPILTQARSLGGDGQAKPKLVERGERDESSAELRT